VHGFVSVIVNPRDAASCLLTWINSLNCATKWSRKLQFFEVFDFSRLGRSIDIDFIYVVCILMCHAFYVCGVYTVRSDQSPTTIVYIHCDVALIIPNDISPNELVVFILIMSNILIK
jgi:hypothetical protein